MNINFSLLIQALALALVLEGIGYTLLAPRMPEFFRFMAEQKPSTLRGGGLAAIGLGLLVLWLAS